MTLLTQYGLILGGVLILLVSACAVLLGRKAAVSVRRFREEHHESFLGEKKR
jgi:hypothetical protein